MYEKALSKRASLIFTNKVFAYALAVSEENASMGQVVTAPTCGASGVIPGVLRGMKEEYELVEKHILRGLAIAGLIGNLVKQNATISGAEGVVKQKLELLVQWQQLWQHILWVEI